MNFILSAVGLAAVVLVATQISNAIRISKLRHSGLYPQPGQATMADVVRLQKAGMTVCAIRCYREIHRCSLRQGKEAVENLAADL